MEKIFLDSASTTFCSDEVIDAMIPCFKNIYGNPASQHSIGREALKVVNDSREIVAKSINCKSNEIYFTSSGTEANNLAIIGIARANKLRGNHIITSKTEHQSIIDSCKLLEKEGFKISYINSDKDGKVDVKEFENSITKNTILASFMLVNNETGCITNIKELSFIAKSNGIIFHTDAVAGYGNLKIDVCDLNVDSLTVSAQKIYGPKGVGALFVKKSVKFEPVIHGGSQESGKRAGTVNVPCIAGFAKAVEIMTNDFDKNIKTLTSINNYFTNELKKINFEFTINGKNRIPNILSVTFKDINNTMLQLLLDINGLCVSLGSACTAGSNEPSHVLLGMGFDENYAKSTIRFSFHKNLTIDKLTRAVEVIEKCLNTINSN